MAELPKVQIGDKTYYDDAKLREYRNVDNPHDKIDYDNTVICPDCGKILTELHFKDEGHYNIANKSETDGTERFFTCPECNAEIDKSDLEAWGII